MWRFVNFGCFFLKGWWCWKPVLGLMTNWPLCFWEMKKNTMESRDTVSTTSFYFCWCYEIRCDDPCYTPFRVCPPGKPSARIQKWQELKSPLQDFVERWRRRFCTSDWIKSMGKSCKTSDLSMVFDRKRMNNPGETGKKKGVFLLLVCGFGGCKDSGSCVGNSICSATSRWVMLCTVITFETTAFEAHPFARMLEFSSP